MFVEALAVALALDVFRFLAFARVASAATAGELGLPRFEPLVDFLGGKSLPAGVVRQDEGRLEPLVREEEVDFEVGRDVEALGVAVAAPEEVQERAVPDLVGEDEEPLGRVERHVEVDVDEDAVAVGRRRRKALVAHRHEVEPHHERTRERQLHQELLPVLGKKLGDFRLCRRKILQRVIVTV